MATVYVLIDDVAENHYQVLSAHSTRPRAVKERKRLYAERDIEKDIAGHIKGSAELTPMLYQYLYGKNSPEKVARWKYETIRITTLVVDQPT